MKKLISGISCAALILATTVMLSPGAMAQDNGANQPVTQAELARLLVRVLGLTHHVPPGAGPNAYFDVLHENGIFPKEPGWRAGEPVETGMLARLLVQALRLTHEVEDIDSYDACIAVLQERNIPITSVGVALAQVRGRDRQRTTTPNTIGGPIDPIIRRDPRSFNPEDEPTGGTDADGGVGGSGGPAAQLYVIRGRLRALIPMVTEVPVKRAVERPVTPTNAGNASGTGGD